MRALYRPDSSTVGLHVIGLHDSKLLTPTLDLRMGRLGCGEVDIYVNSDVYACTTMELETASSISDPKRL